MAEYGRIIRRVEKTANLDIDERSRREGAAMNGEKELCGICSMVGKRG